jgi:hypothetical protein
MMVVKQHDAFYEMKIKQNKCRKESKDKFSGAINKKV